MKLFALWFSLFTMLASGLPPSNARAQPNVQVFYSASNGYCGLQGAYLWQVGAELRLDGGTEVVTGTANSPCGYRQCTSRSGCARTTRCQVYSVEVERIEFGDLQRVRGLVV